MIIAENHEADNILFYFIFKLKKNAQLHKLPSIANNLHVVQFFFKKLKKLKPV